MTKVKSVSTNLLKSLAAIGIFAAIFNPINVAADVCVKNQSNTILWTNLECGFSAAKAIFGTGGTTTLEHGQSICKNNKILFVPTPCVFAAIDYHKGENRSCYSTPFYNDSKTGSDLFSGTKLPMVHNGSTCKLH